MENLFATTAVKDVIKENRSIVVLKTSDSLEHALSVLANHQILSAPVQNEHGNCVGFVDCYEILTAIVTSMGSSGDSDNKSSKDTLSWSKLWDQYAVHLKNFEQASKVFSSTTVGQCGRGAFYSIKSSAKLPALVSFMQSKQVHRLAVTSEDRVMTNLISQSDIIRWLARNVNLLGRFASVTCKDIGFEKTVYTVDANEPALNAFKQMHVRQVSAVAVTDSSTGNKLVATISSSDLTGLTRDNFAQLLLPSAKFVSQWCQRPKLPPFTVTVDSSFEFVCLKLAATGVHRLWLVDKDEKLAGLISTVDVLRFVDLRLAIASQQDETETISSKGSTLRK